MTAPNPVSAPPAPRTSAGAHRAPESADEALLATLPDAADSEATQAPADTDSDARLFRWRDVLDYFTPPAPWGDPPASLTDLSSYAHTAAWAPSRGFRRRVGIAYWYLLGLPLTIVLRYAEWIVQRPGRLVVVLGLAAVLWRTWFGRTTVHAVGAVLHIVFYPLTWLF